MKVTQAHEVLYLQEAGRVAARALNVAKGLIKPGMTTLELDKIIEDVIYMGGCLPAFKGYRGYKHASCISINAEVVHGIPSAEIIFREGDLVSIDTGAIKDGYYSDTAISIILPPASSEALRLIKRTEHALKAGIAAAQVGAKIGDISLAIKRAAGNYGIIRGYSGHCVGKTLQELPQIPNQMEYSEKDDVPFNIELEAGMIMAIEPMFCLGGENTIVKPDGWTVVTTDGSLCAHFENTIQLTEFGPVILTE